MTIPTGWQCRHIFPFPIFLGFTLIFLGIYFMDGWITGVGIVLIVTASIIFNFVLPEHGDPWSKRNATGTTNKENQSVSEWAAKNGILGADESAKWDTSRPALASESQREAAKTADEKPDGQAENAKDDESPPR